MIPTPDYQGHVDRMTPALDNLLVGIQRRRERQAEERQFARQLTLQKNQQEFQAAMHEDSQEFQKVMTDQANEFRTKLVGVQQDFQIGMAEMQIANQNNNAAAARALQKEGLEIEQQRANDQKEYWDSVAEAQEAGTTAQKDEAFREAYENAVETVENEYAQLFTEMDAQYNLIQDQAGNVYLNFLKAGDDTVESVPVGSLNNRFGKHKRLYSILQDTIGNRENVRSIPTDSIDDGVERVVIGGTENRFYPFESFTQGISRSLRNDDVESIFSNGVLRQEFFADTREVVTPEPKDNLTNYELVIGSGTPLKFEVDGEEFEFAFGTMEYGTLKFTQEELIQHITDTKSKFFDDYSHKALFADIQKRMDAYREMAVLYGRENNLSGDEINKLQLTARDRTVDNANIASFFSGTTIPTINTNSQSYQDELNLFD